MPYPPMMSRRSFALTTLAMLTVNFATIARADGGISLNKQGHAIKGYDSHGYWTVGAARPGLDDHIVEWNGALWRFATAEDAVVFAKTPTAFAPQFGGYCTRAMSFKKLVPADPEVWRIYGDKLYMFARPIGGTKFDEGQDAMIAKAQAFWDTL